MNNSTNYTLDDNSEKDGVVEDKLNIITKQG